MLTQEKIEYWSKNFDLIANHSVDEDFLNKIEDEISQLPESEINELVQWVQKARQANSLKTNELINQVKKMQNPNK